MMTQSSGPVTLRMTSLVYSRSETTTTDNVGKATETATTAARFDPAMTAGSDSEDMVTMPLPADR